MERTGFVTTGEAVKSVKIEQGLQTTASSLVCNKIVTLILLHRVYGCFQAIAAVLNAATQTVWPPKSKIFSIWPLTKEVANL